MSTITKELAKLFRKITNSEIDAEGNANVVLSPADSLLINNARIALASLEAEPVAWLLSGGGAKNNVSFDSGNAYADPLREVTPLYTAPPAPVDNIHPLLEFAREYIESWDLGMAGDSSLLASAKQAIADSSAQQLAPVSVPDEHNSVIAEQLAHVLSGMDVTDHQRAIINCAVDRLNKNAEVIQQKPVYSEVPEALDYQGAKELYNYLMNEEETNATVNGWNACRAAMLHGAEPVSNSDELPLDYLQGHKDGLEWAAQLAEANHPQTGDWLYDDPLELAKAIRKGPDMPTSPVQGWIPCSERMPQKNERVIIFINFNSETVPPSIHDAQFTGSTFRRGNATVNVFPLEDGYGVTHWMPLPEAPKQEA